MVALASWAKPVVSAAVASLMVKPPLQTISEFVTSRNSACTARFCPSRSSINRSDSTCRNALRPDTAPMRPITATPRMLDSSMVIRILDWMPNRNRLRSGVRRVRFAGCGAGAGAMSDSASVSSLVVNRLPFSRGRSAPNAAD